MVRHATWLILLAWLVAPGAATRAAETLAAAPAQGQVPRAMHGPMHQRPRITVGVSQAEIVGSTHRALQAAVDYVASLGGGVVEIGPGTYEMRDSLHLRSQVAVHGTPGRTILRKADSTQSPLAIDGDYGEEQFTPERAAGFQVGDGVAIWDQHANGFHTTVARITGGSDGTFSISRPLNADCMVESGAQVATVFPIVSGYDVEGAEIVGLTIDGNREHAPPLNGCRGGGVFLYRCPGALIQHCVVRNYAGDGFSFQQSNDVTMSDCLSEANANLGIHPGSGSQRPIVRRCTARGNGDDGLFLCWRVKFGLFEDNVLEGNGRFGISIGHKDTDNLLRHNQVRGNREHGVFFRNESEGMAGHRNRLEGNAIEDNGHEPGTAAICVRGATRDLVFKDNRVRDTRSGDARRQTIGIRLEEQVGAVVLEDNQIEAPTAVDDRRRSP